LDALPFGLEAGDNHPANPLAEKVYAWAGSYHSFDFAAPPVLKNHQKNLNLIRVLEGEIRNNLCFFPLRPGCHISFEIGRIANTMRAYFGKIDEVWRI
jgi:hypothetical protein